MYLAGHFSANNLLAADYSTTMNATELRRRTSTSPTPSSSAPAATPGYTIVNGDAVPNVTQTLDWMQAFAQKRATVIAGTGYQYGDTDFLEYSERLYKDFAEAFRFGTGPVSVGDALVSAKQRYLADTPSLGGHPPEGAARGDASTACRCRRQPAGRSQLRAPGRGADRRRDHPVGDRARAARSACASPT